MGEYVNPLWFEEGMEVLIPWNREANAPGRDRNGTAARCKVATAAGEHARVVNDRLGVDKWYHRDSLLVPKTDPHAV